MEIEPKVIGKEDLKGAMKDAINIVKGNAFVYFVIFSAIYINVLFSIMEPLWLIINPLVYGVLYVSIFELTCTVKVGYGGTTYQKLKISLKSGAKTFFILVFSHPIYSGLYLLLFYSIQAKTVFPIPGVTETVTQDWLIAFKASSWIGMFLSGFCNMFVSVRMGCIAMFLNNIKEYSIINDLVDRSRRKNIDVMLDAAKIGLLMLLICVFSSEILTPLLIGYCLITGFFLFERIFEPPQLKQQQEQEENNVNVVPEAT